MADTDTTWTSEECEVQAGASDAEGRGMDASGDFFFDFFERTAASDLGAHGMVTDGPGEAETKGGGGHASAHAAAAARACAMDCTAVGSGGGAGAETADEGTLPSEPTRKRRGKRARRGGRDGAY